MLFNVVTLTPALSPCRSAGPPSLLLSHKDSLVSELIQDTVTVTAAGNTAAFHFPGLQEVQLTPMFSRHKYLSYSELTRGLQAGGWSQETGRKQIAYKTSEEQNLVTYGCNLCSCGDSQNHNPPPLSDPLRDFLKT